MRRGRIGRPGLVGTMARTAVVAGTANAVVGGMNRRQAAGAQAQQQQAMAQQQAYENQAQIAEMQAQQQPAPPPPAPPAAAAPADDMMAKLTQLGELHSQGILDDDEFKAAKAKLLA